jgi:Phosphatidate cytidylyltransferase, mitochondrial
VLPFIEQTHDIEKAIEINRDHAMHTALLLNYHKLDISLMDLATTICDLSYKGDVRMRFKMENPDKVKNIVLGSYDGLNSLYGIGCERFNTLK